MWIIIATIKTSKVPNSPSTNAKSIVSIDSQGSSSWVQATVVARNLSMTCLINKMSLLVIISWNYTSIAMYVTWYAHATVVSVSSSTDGVSGDGTTASFKSFPSCLKAVLPSQSARSSRPICRRRCTIAECVLPLPSAGCSFQCNNWRRHGISSSTLRSYPRERKYALGII